MNLVLGLNLTTVSENEIRIPENMLISGLTDIYLSYFTAAFDPGGSVNSISPDVI
jgi:hypothetical protein